MSDAFAQILAAEGFQGLYRGLAPASIKIIPMASVSFGVYELAKHLLSQAGEAAQKARLEKASREAEKRRRAVVIIEETECGGEKEGGAGKLKKLQ
jgi:hypothetical protein